MCECVALSGLGCGRKDILRKNVPNRLSADHSAVATPDKGSKLKKERVFIIITNFLLKLLC